jgi:hypothetical protein
MTPIYGIVKDGRIELTSPLPEGTRVEVQVIAGPGEFTPDEQEEFAAWQLASARALENFERTLAEDDANDAPR